MTLRINSVVFSPLGVVVRVLSSGEMNNIFNLTETNHGGESVHAASIDLGKLDRCRLSSVTVRLPELKALQASPLSRGLRRWLIAGAACWALWHVGPLGQPTLATLNWVGEWPHRLRRLP